MVRKILNIIITIMLIVVPTYVIGLLVLKYTLSMSGFYIGIFLGLFLIFMLSEKINIDND